MTTIAHTRESQHPNNQPERSAPENAFRAFLENSPDMVVLFGPSGTIGYANPFSTRILGHTPAALVGTDGLDYVHPDDRGRVRAVFVTCTGEPGGTFTETYRVRHQNGSWRRLEARGVNLLHEPGIEAVVTSYRDVTHQHAVEDALRAAMQGSLDAVYVLASDRNANGQITDFVITDVNANGARLIAMDRDQVVGRRLCELLPVNRTGGYFDRYVGVVETGKPLEEEFPITTDDGRALWLHHQVVRAGDGVVITTRDVTARKVSESALRRGGEQYRRLFEASPHPMWVYDTRTLAFLAVNDAAVARYGYTRAEFARLTLRDIRAAVDVPALSAALRVSDGSPRVWRHRWKDGTVRLVEVTGHDLEYDGRPGRLVLAHDVTDREHATAALREREELLRSIIDNIPCGVFWKDRNSVYLGCNVLFARDYGLANPGAAVGRTDLDMGASRTEAELFRACDQRVMETGRALLGFEEALTRADGTRAVLMTSKVPLRSPDGTAVGMLGIYQDITERKRAEDEARAWRVRYEAAVRATGQVLYDWDVRTNRVSWGGSSEATLGYPEPELPADLAGWAALIHPDDRAAFDREIERCGASESPFRLEYRVRRKDGAYITVDDQGHFVPGPGGAPTERMVGFVSDVTDRKRLEEQFRQAQKMEAVGQLAGGVAHDFNNLLTIINGYSDLILTTLHAPGPARSMVEAVRKAGDRAADLTRQLLAFGRQQLLQPKVLDLNAVVADTAQMLRRLIGEDVELVTRPGAPLLLVRADPGQINQVLMNLAVNARDAMPTGGTLTIGTQNEVLEAGTAPDGAEVLAGPYVRLSVTDTGTGMPEDVRCHIFEPFFTTKEQGKGTGLGLATVFGIVKQSGGHIEVETAVGRGTTFHVYLPGIGGVTAGQSPGESSAPKGAEVVLVVEDEPGVRGLAELALRKQGYQVLGAASAEEARALVTTREGAIDLLVTDVVMPGTGGRVLAEWLLATDPRIRVLYMSGYTDDAVVRHGVEAARVNFIQKPFTPSSLARKVREVLDARG